MARYDFDEAEVKPYLQLEKMIEAAFHAAGRLFGLTFREQAGVQERAALAPYFSNLDSPVFALTGLPEVVKGALFARYSRSPKSLRRWSRTRPRSSRTMAVA